MTTEEILQSITSICAAFHPKEVLLFGSRAKGCATARSDFDIAVSGVASFDALKEAIDSAISFSPPAAYTAALRRKRISRVHSRVLS